MLMDLNLKIINLILTAMKMLKIFITIFVLLAFANTNILKG